MGMYKGMNTMQRPAAAPTVTIRRLPASGNTALAASALIQAALGIEFFLSGLNKFADPHFVRNFKLFVEASPGTQHGLLAPLIHSLVPTLESSSASAAPTGGGRSRRRR